MIVFCEMSLKQNFGATFPQPVCVKYTAHFLHGRPNNSRVGVFSVAIVWVCLGQAVMVNEHVKGLLLAQVVSVVPIPAIPTPRS